MKKSDVILVGEALIGEGNEVAHVDLIAGPKDGPVGAAFANGLSQLSKGHTPLLAVVRPNLATKPATLLIPKVTVDNLEDANKIFGPAQSGVAKAVVDSVAEGVFPKEHLEDYVVLCSVFIHPQATDYDKIYRYNYSATKLALKRALGGEPTLEKLVYEKDRAVHPFAKSKMTRLWRPPYLQVAIDITNMEAVKQLIDELPKNDMILLEAGTTFIKEHGMRGLEELRHLAGDRFLIADLKTLDVGKVEVDMAYNATADAVVVSGLADKTTIENVIYEAHRLGIYAIIDMMNVKSPKVVLTGLKEDPDVVILHRSIDKEESRGKGAKSADSGWKAIREIKEAHKKVLLAVAGGVSPETAKDALASGADILIVGRYITQSKDIERSAREFIRLLGTDTDLFRTHVE